MTKQIVFLLSIFLLAGCFDGGSGSGNSEPTPESVGKSNFNPADFTVNQILPLPENGESQLNIQLNNLVSDDAIYITASSGDVDNGKLKITPYRTILNPTKGSAQVLLQIEDLGLTAQPDVTIEVTTSGNTKMEQTVSIEWANEL